jgi:nucleoside-diphosphate-sugar epimerase
MRVAITGASGFVGRNLLKHLESSEIRTIPISRAPLDSARWRLSPSLADDGASDQWTRSLLDAEVVVHTAARTHAMKGRHRDQLQSYRSINRDGALTVAEGAARAGVRRMVLLSTVKVLGEWTPEGAAFRNADPPAPSDAYAVSKAEAEDALADLAEKRGLELVILRLPLVYGHGMRGNLAALARLVHRGVWLPLGGVRDNRRSFIGTENLSSAVRAAMTAPAAPAGRFLVSDGADLSTRDLLTHLAVAAGRSARAFNIPEPWLRRVMLSVGQVDRWSRLFGNLQVDIRETMDRLEWKPPIAVAEGMTEIFHPTRTDPYVA